MLTNNTKRVTEWAMFFRPIIARRDLQTLADSLGLPVKNVRRWVDTDSIPGEWFQACARVRLASLDELADAAERRRLARGPRQWATAPADPEARP